MIVDPTVYAATILATVFATLIGHRLLDYARSRDSKVSLQVEILSLKGETKVAGTENDPVPPTVFHPTASRPM